MADQPPRLPQRRGRTRPGIGRAVAHLLAANGAAVVVSDLKQDAVDKVVEGIKAAGGTAAAHVGDVSQPESAFEAVKAAGKLAPLKIAVNNAGIGGAIAPLADYPLDSWDKVIAVNLNAVMYGMRAQLPAMVAAGGARSSTWRRSSVVWGFPCRRPM